jgi:hypothetical protein
MALGWAWDGLRMGDEGEGAGLDGFLGAGGCLWCS